LIGRSLAQRQAYAVRGRGADQRRAAHLHGLDRAGGVLDGLERGDRELVRQFRLVDDLHRPTVRRDPDGAICLAADVHAPALGTPTASPSPSYRRRVFDTMWGGDDTGGQWHLPLVYK